MSLPLFFSSSLVVVDAQGRVLVRNWVSRTGTVMINGTPCAVLAEIQEKTAGFSILCRDILNQLPPVVLKHVRREDRAVLRNYWENAPSHPFYPDLRMHRDLLF